MSSSASRNGESARIRQPVAAHLDQVWGGVDARALIVARRCQLECHAGAASKVQDPVAGLDAEHHVGIVLESDVLMVVGLPVVAPARAVIEASMLLSLEAALVSADSALNRQTCTPDQLRRMFARLNHWPGSQRIHVVLHHMDGRAESPGETRSRFMFWRQGLPVPELQFHVYDEGGELVAITDFAWHEQKVFGEFDGQVKYGRLLREGEEPGDAVFREKRREDLVRAITGYGCGRLAGTNQPTTLRRRTCRPPGAPSRR